MNELLLRFAEKLTAQAMKLREKAVEEAWDNAVPISAEVRMRFALYMEVAELAKTAAAEAQDAPVKPRRVA